MRTSLRLLCLVGIAGLFGCAHNRVVGYGKATVKMTRADVTELHEAFKTQSEKTIALPTLGEAKCTERLCRIPIRGTATVLEDGKMVGSTQVRGTLAFRPAAAQL